MTHTRQDEDRDRSLRMLQQLVDERAGADPRTGWHVTTFGAAGSPYGAAVELTQHTYAHCPRCAQRLELERPGPVTWIDPIDGDECGAYDWQHHCGEWNTPVSVLRRIDLDDLQHLDDGPASEDDDDLDAAGAGADAEARDEVDAERVQEELDQVLDELYAELQALAGQDLQERRGALRRGLAADLLEARAADAANRSAGQNGPDEEESVVNGSETRWVHHEDGQWFACAWDPAGDEGVVITVREDEVAHLSGHELAGHELAATTGR